MAKQLVTLTVNGDEHELAVAPFQTLLEVLRDDLGLIGTKRGCTAGSCGVCTVNGEKGERFDTSIDRGPYNFTLGAGMVIPGWDIGIEGLQVGSTATLIIPPAMGYGAKGSPPKIPPNSTLCFEVQLLEIAGK